MTTSDPTIEVIGLTKKYGSFTALDSLNLKIEGAKCVGFLGPNGAGKTTTLCMVTWKRKLLQIMRSMKSD